MPVNHYFQGGDGIGSSEEKKLFEDLILEGLKIYGHDVYYLPRTLVNQDLILGEDVASKFNAAYLCEMYMDTTEGFGGEQELISKFGLEIREDSTFTVSKRRWNDLVEDPATLIKADRPNEGDLIYFPLMNSFFEIQFVEDQEPFFQLGNLPVYKLRVTRFEYSSERLDTGVSDIDAAEDKYSLDMLNHQMTLEAEEGSLLLENDSASGESNYFLLESYEIQTQSPYADNIDLDNEAGFDTASVSDDILDFTERNPFGEVDFGG
jgi:hypothetical protein|tara:strand:- start:2204 stop:2995 length:792 start_codon:yes stop_codon:yes gene_type:complete